MAKQKDLDPRDINGRLYHQIHRLLEEVEKPDVDENVTIRERIAMIIAVARIQTVFITLRKEKQENDEFAGSKVRRYAGSFKTNDARRGAKTAGSAGAEPEPDEFSWDDDDDADSNAA